MQAKVGDQTQYVGLDYAIVSSLISIKPEKMTGCIIDIWQRKLHHLQSSKGENRIPHNWLFLFYLYLYLFISLSLW